MRIGDTDCSKDHMEYIQEDCKQSRHYMRMCFLQDKKNLNTDIVFDN